MLQFASRISGMRFCEASAKDNFNVDEIFLKLVDDIVSKVESGWQIEDKIFHIKKWICYLEFFWFYRLSKKIVLNANP